MKKNIVFLISFIGLVSMTTPASSVTLSGSGCNTWGLSSYIFVNEGTSLALINGVACIISNPTAEEASRLSAVVSQAQASGRSVAIGTGSSLGGGNPNGLVVAMQ